MRKTASVCLAAMAVPLLLGSALLLWLAERVRGPLPEKR